MDSPGDRKSVHKVIENFPFYPTDKAKHILESSCKNSLDFVQRLAKYKTLSVHTGCVNTVNWNESGTHVLSGSDDNHLIITEMKSGRMALKCKTPHKRHIFSARFMPHTSDREVISCSGEGLVAHTEFFHSFGPGQALEENALVRDADRYISKFNCHKYGCAYDVIPLPDTKRTFLSCGEDGTVRQFDLRTVSRCILGACNKYILINCPCSVTAMDIAPINHHKIVIGCSDSVVRFYDRRHLSTSTLSNVDSIHAPYKAYPIPMKYTRRHYRPTYLKFNKDESELLVSYSMEHVYIYNLKHPGFSDTEILKSKCYTSKLRREDDPEPQVPRLRFRGDWSDTGPSSQAPGDPNATGVIVAQARPHLEPGVLGRLSDEIYNMLNMHPAQPSRFGTQEQRFNEDALQNTAEDNSKENDDSNAVASGAEGRQQLSIATYRAKLEKSSPVDNFDYVKMQFKGHRNARTMVKSACFWGDDFIMSGSDCGYIFIWDRHTGKVVKTLLADAHVVNRVVPHPIFPFLLSSGIDYDIKIWSPMAPVPVFDEVQTLELIKRNADMLVATRDTVAVPAQVMIRILAGLHQYRRIVNSRQTALHMAMGGNADNETITTAIFVAATHAASAAEVVVAATAAVRANQRAANTNSSTDEGAGHVNEQPIAAIGQDEPVEAPAEGAASLIVNDGNANDENDTAIPVVTNQSNTMDIDEGNN